MPNRWEGSETSVLGKVAKLTSILGGKLKKTVALLASSLLLLTGCSSQAEIDSEACRLLTVMSQNNVDTTSEYHRLSDQLAELSGDVEDQDPNLATKVYKAARSLSPYFADGKESFIANLLGLKSENPIQFDQIQQSYNDARAGCDAASGMNNSSLVLFLSVRDLERELERDADPCLRYMYKASVTSDSTKAERYLKLTADVCAGVDAWYQALKLYPYAMGFPDVMGNELEILCLNYPRTRACTNP